MITDFLDEAFLAAIYIMQNHLFKTQVNEFADPGFVFLKIRRNQHPLFHFRWISAN